MSTLTTYPASSTDRNSNTFISTTASSATSRSTRPEVKLPHFFSGLPSSINTYVNSFLCKTEQRELPFCNWNLFIQIHISNLEVEEHLEAKTTPTAAQKKIIHMFVMKELTSMRSYLPRIVLAKRNIKDPYPFPCSLNPSSSYFNYLPLRGRFNEMRRKQENEIVTKTFWNLKHPLAQFYSTLWYMHLNSGLETFESQPSHWLTFEDEIGNNLVASCGNKLYISNAFRDTVDRLYSKTYAAPTSRNNNLHRPKSIDLLFLFLKKQEVLDCLSFDDLTYALLHIFETELSSIQKEVIYTEELQDVSRLVNELFNHLDTKEGNTRFFEQQLQDFMKAKVLEFQQYTEKSKIDHFRLQSRFVYDMIEANLSDFAFPEEFIDWKDTDLKSCCIIQ